MELVLVSGLSGSGKSIALKVLEDAGYYCVDNLPATLLLETVNFLSEAGHERAAVSIDARSAALPTLPAHLEALRGRGMDCRVLYLEAATPTLLRRFSETRRRHPLAREGVTLSEAIERERALLAGVAAIAQRLDTSDLQARVLQNWVRDLLGIGPSGLTLLFESFAYRDGLPMDADWVIDCRMLPNPYYDPLLRPLCGRDAPVADYLTRDPATQRWLGDVRALLARWLPDIVRENRSSVTVAIGCTGGQHRSVYLVENLAQSFRKEGWQVLTRHRALSRDQAAEGTS
ncbi:MAG TPA: RNase adapter RapZ [Burkholderiales bacterium]|nr:RNase adapter RapZ [Burkholderiales bacterium]